MELIVISISNILCFLIGVIITSKVYKKEEIIKSPATLIKEHKEQIRIEEEQDKIKTMLENIDNYDGTSIGQKDLPE